MLSQSNLDISASMMNTTKNSVAGRRRNEAEKEELSHEQLQKSDSEGYKAIFALVKLFMSKSAHDSVSALTQRSDGFNDRKFKNFTIV